MTDLSTSRRALFRSLVSIIYHYRQPVVNGVSMRTTENLDLKISLKLIFFSDLEVNSTISSCFIVQKGIMTMTN